MFTSSRSARDALKTARDQLADARGWLASLADGLAANSLSRSSALAAAVEKDAPETSYELDRLWPTADPESSLLKRIAGRTVSRAVQSTVI